MGSQNNELGATRLLHAQSHIWNHTFSFMYSIDLNIPEIIHKHGKPMPLRFLISSIQIHPSTSPYVHRLMRLLTYSGLFSLHKLPETSHEDPSPEKDYVLTDSSVLLLKITNWLQNDDPSPFHTAHRMKIWDFSNMNPNFNHSFNEATASDSSLVISVVVERCKDVFKGIKSLVDVAGGTGTIAKAIAKAFPEIECTVFDLPHVVDGLQDSENLKFVGGNMFEAVPPRCDTDEGDNFKTIIHERRGLRENWQSYSVLLVLLITRFILF